MFRFIRLAALACCVLFVLCASGVAQTVYCASEDGHRHSCAADIRAGVELQTQHSKSPCQRDSSWGVDRRGIWVDHGCRAEFALSTASDDRGWGQGQRVIYCSSDDMQRHYCSADTSGGVRVTAQRSESECRRGYSWGYDRQGIWVDRGCRADFEVGLPRHGRWRDEHDRDEDYQRDRREEGFGVQLTCASENMRRQFCTANTWRGVVLVHVHSDSPCRFGETWGYDRQGIWVDRGCRADFRTGQ